MRARKALSSLFGLPLLILKGLRPSSAVLCWEALFSTSPVPAPYYPLVPCALPRITESFRVEKVSTITKSNLESSTDKPTINHTVKFYSYVCLEGLSGW